MRFVSKDAFGVVQFQFERGDSGIRGIVEFFVNQPKRVDVWVPHYCLNREIRFAMAQSPSKTRALAILNHVLEKHEKGERA